MIPHNRPFITGDDRAAVDSVLSSGWLAQGREVAALEADFVRRYRLGGACAVGSGTAALFLAMRALGAGRGDNVLVPSYSCSAILNAVIMTGASPRVADVLPQTFCLDPAAATAQASDTRFVVAVHTYGAVADIRALKSRAIVIEDCCQALGGTVAGVPLGRVGAAAVFSFYATKIVAGGQGGLVWSPNASVAENVRDYREFDGRERYEPRFNLQMTDIHAALVNSQMARLESIRARRAVMAAAYLSALPNGLATQAGVSEPGRIVHRFVVVTPDRAVRDRFRAHMVAAGVGCIVPVQRFELLHRYLNLDPASYPISERLADTTLSLPMHLGVSDDEVSIISDAIGGFRP